MVVLVADIAENPRLPKPVRLDSTTHMRVHKSSCIHNLLHTCILLTLSHINMPYLHAYILNIIGTHFSCGRGPAVPRFVLGSSVLRYTQSVSYVLATKKVFILDSFLHVWHLKFDILHC